MEKEKTREMNLQIRPYRNTDYPEVSALLAEVFESKIGQSTLEMQYLGEERDITVAIDTSSSALLGCAITEVRNDYVKDRRILFLNYLAVTSARTKNGVGSCLLRTVEELCSLYGCSAIELTSANFRIDAHAFYRSHDFSVKKTTVFVKELDKGNGVEPKP